MHCTYVFVIFNGSKREKTHSVELIKQTEEEKNEVVTTKPIKVKTQTFLGRKTYWL